MSSGFAQRGDKKGEEQAAPTHFEIPPAPALSPENALKSFKVAPGFKIELVASEPLIEAPIALTFAPDGRLWVLEMRSFMRDIEGNDESLPVGRVSVLSDENGDGQMDKSVVFADGLVMPRALALFRDGLLVAEPPKLWFMRDTNHDGKADEKTEIFSDYGNPANPEHTSNGLMWGLDNWLYSANHTARYRFKDGKWVQESSAFRGQWGITQDDYGRIFHNSNSDQLRADLIPSRYLARNSYLTTPGGINVQLSREQSVWPIRVNPGVNRGYQKGQLRTDGTLATFTAACGPCIYRGENFPSDFYGAAFLCEPAGNVVRCNKLYESGTSITASNAFQNTEFLASRDERFRPVNLFNGPDGGLYVVDMYHGVLQHRIYVTTYLRNQALSRGLDKPINMGRIYRVVSTSKTLSKPSNLAAPTTDLVAELTSKNGWRRETAQRLLVEKRDPSTVPPLENLAMDTSNPIARIHALWTLEGMGQLTEKVVAPALEASDPKLLIVALQLSERFLEKPAVLDKVVATATTDRLDVLWQSLLTLGEAKTLKAERAMAGILARFPQNPLFRDAAASGLRGRELAFLTLADETLKDRSSALVTRLAGCVVAEAKGDDVIKLLDWAQAHSARAAAALDAFAALEQKRPRRNAPPLATTLKTIKLATKPAALTELAKVQNPEVQRRLTEVEKVLVWPGKTGAAPVPVVIALTTEEQTRFENGKTLYVATCGACHQPHGMGQDGLAPPLLESEWTLGSPQRLARIVLQGVRGLIHIKGKAYSLDMPPLGVLDDEQIASLLTYVRREWGHTASPVSPAFIAEVRAATMSREEAWSEADLLRIPEK